MKNTLALGAALACLALPAFAPAQVEGIDPDAMADVLDLLVDPEVTADEISTQLTACLQPIFDNGLAYAPIIIETEFDSDGAPKEPIILDPAPAAVERPHLRQLVRAEMAIFDCAPVSVGGSPVIDVRLAFEVDAEGIRIAASAATETEEDLTPAELTRNQRRQAQVRLRLAGMDPGTPDGVFGPRTRDAVSQWQDENGFRPTGELTESQAGKLWDDTQEAYDAWVKTQRSRASSSRGSSGSRVYRGSDGCLRYRANNRIVPSQSLRCDAKGLVQGF